MKFKGAKSRYGLIGSWPLPLGPTAVDRSPSTGSRRVPGSDRFSTPRRDDSFLVGHFAQRWQGHTQLSESLVCDLRVINVKPLELFQPAEMGQTDVGDTGPIESQHTNFRQAS